MLKQKKHWDLGGPFDDVEAILWRASIAIRTVEMCEELLRDPLCTEEERVEIKKRMFNAVTKKKMFDTAMQFIQRDRYFDIINMRYIQNMGDVEIAESLHVDPATVRRNRKRLLAMICDFCREFIA